MQAVLDHLGVGQVVIHQVFERGAMTREESQRAVSGHEQYRPAARTSRRIAQGGHQLLRIPIERREWMHLLHITGRGRHRTPLGREDVHGDPGRAE